MCWVRSHGERGGVARGAALAPGTPSPHGLTGQRSEGITFHPPRALPGETVGPHCTAKLGVALGVTECDQVLRVWRGPAQPPPSLLGRPPLCRAQVLSSASTREGACPDHWSQQEVHSQARLCRWPPGGPGVTQLSAKPRTPTWVCRPLCPLAE